LACTEPLQAFSLPTHGEQRPSLRIAKKLLQVHWFCQLHSLGFITLHETVTTLGVARQHQTLLQRADLSLAVFYTLFDLGISHSPWGCVGFGNPLLAFHHSQRSGHTDLKIAVWMDTEVYRPGLEGCWEYMNTVDLEMFVVHTTSHASKVADRSVRLVVSENDCCIG